MTELRVNGSTNRTGCTHTTRYEIQNVLTENNIETELFWIGRAAISGCIGCGVCANSGRCFIKDRVNEFLDKCNDFDGFVFGGPVHFAAMNGAMTSFMDRVFFCARAKNEMAYKPAATITSCRRSGSTSTLDQLNKYPIHRGRPLVPSQYVPLVY